MIIPFRRVYALLEGGCMAMAIAFPTHVGREGSGVGKGCLTKAFHCVLPSLKVCDDSIGW